MVESTVYRTKRINGSTGSVNSAETGLGSGLGSGRTEELRVVPGEQVHVQGKRHRFAGGMRWKAHWPQGIGSDHFGEMLIQGCAVMMVERQVLVTGVILRLVVVIRIMHRNERSQVQFFTRGLMVQEMGEKKGQLHQVGAY